MAESRCGQPPEPSGRWLSGFSLPTLLREVRESRARIIALADGERRRIERDLHDGAQQRLIALRIKLDAAAESLEDRDCETAGLLRNLGDQAQAALEELRSLARGVYPAALADHGLIAAVHSAALHGPIPTTIVAQPGRRYRREVETTAYFCCLEAIQNTTKHAPRATEIRIALTERDTVIEIEIRDDGPGFDPDHTEPGAGITNMQDRLATVDGELHVRSRPGAGTRLLVTIPLHAGTHSGKARLGAGHSPWGSDCSKSTQEPRERCDLHTRATSARRNSRDALATVELASAPT
ncbi:MAG: sensor histidine kinase [Solirubrobacterales bacterium]|nr:sensor histidine kinase [Solirubrobacterales bacterium]